MQRRGILVGFLCLSVFIAARGEASAPTSSAAVSGVVGVPNVGMKAPFPTVKAVGPPAEFELWRWGAPSERKRLMPLPNGARISVTELPKGLHVLFRIPVPHDTVRCEGVSTDSFDRIGWGPEKVSNPDPSERHWYRIFAEQYAFPPQVGRYYLMVEASKEGKVASRSAITFDFVNPSPPPRNTRFTVGKRDTQGHPITGSRPVEWRGLNETPVLRDNDYPFEAQHAYNAINFERFPPFHLPPRFITVWNSRRFTDESKFGGPLDRGFTVMETIHSAQDNLPLRQRAWFHTPDLQVMFIEKWFKEDPKRYADLKAYADYRSAFVSPENAFKLGWTCYESWGAGGYAPYDAGIYGFDEEQMWPTIAVKMLREHPEALPEAIRKLADGDPKADRPDTQARLQDAYTQAWGDFVGHYYRGARARAAERGRVFKIWHYGSKAPGDALFINREEGKPNPQTGRYAADELPALASWFKSGDRVDYTATEYARQVDFFHKDFYYHTLFPQTVSMYEKDAAGKYALDETGRRKIRQDLFEETVYVTPTKVGYEDAETGPAFLKAFLGKGENALYWLNGGKYYKTHGTLTPGKGMIPALRPGNQETWGKTGQLGSRPVNPYLAEAAPIYTFMMGLEGLYFWDSRLYTGPLGAGPDGNMEISETLGDIEYIVKGMHRVSQLNRLFEGDYSFVRPVRHYDIWNRDHPIIRGVINGRYLALAMTNPYLDPGETQTVELRYDSPFPGSKAGAAKPAKPIWSGTVRLQSRKTGLFQCRLPALPNGKAYDPDRLYFRYTCADGEYRHTFTVTGDYEVPYPQPAND